MTLKPRQPLLLAATSMVACLATASAHTSAGRSAVTPQRTGIPECDKYAAMVTACLPKMCEEERLLREMQLGFALEMIPKGVELNGRQQAAQACARDIAEEIKNDEYGCYPATTADPGPPRSIRLEAVQPSAMSVTLTFSGSGPATGEEARVVVARSISEPPLATYPLAGWTGQFVLDTASASPVIKGGPTDPIRLEPQTTYCFAVVSSVGSRTGYYRKGIFTTLPNK